MTAPLIPGYEDLTVLGRGGFATVYRARQAAFNRDVAIKVLDVADVEADVLLRFERECLALGSLSGHPNIVTVFGGGSTDLGHPYLVMELMEGGSLAARIKRDGPMSAVEVVRIGGQLLDAIAAAHDAGVIHRDIKPGNVLISRYGQVELADFGISSIPGGYETGSGLLTATVAYAAPEVLRGEPATASSDCYSLAVTLDSLIGSGASPQLVRVLHRAMERLPAARYASAAEFAEALASVPEAAGVAFEGESTVPVVTPVSDPIDVTRQLEAPIQASTQPRRRPVVLAVVLAVLLIAGAAAVWFATRDAPADEPPPVVSVRRAVTVEAGPAGSLRIDVGLSSDAACAPNAYRLEQNTSGSWTRTLVGQLKTGTNVVQVVDPGRYRVVLVKQSGPSAVCPRTTSAAVVVDPEPVVIAPTKGPDKPKPGKPTKTPKHPKPHKPKG